MRCSWLLIGTLILAVTCSFTEYAWARDRHAGPSSSSSEKTPSKFESESNADTGVDQEVLFRRIEDTKELAKILNVPFNKNFLDKAIDFYAQRGMLTDDPKITEDDIRGFLKEVAGKADTESLVNVGKAFVQERQEEFRNQQSKPDRDGDRDDDRRDGRDRFRDRDGDGEGRRGSRISGLMEKMGAELKEIEKIEKELAKGLGAVGAPAATGISEGNGGPGNSAPGVAATQHKPGTAPASESTANGPKDLPSQIAGTPTAATFFPPTVSFATAPQTAPAAAFNDPFVAKPKLEIASTPENRSAPSSGTTPTASPVAEPASPKSAEPPVASIAERLIPRGKSFAVESIPVPDADDAKPLANAAAPEALPIVPIASPPTVPLVQNGLKGSLLPPQEMEDGLDAEGRAVANPAGATAGTPSSGSTSVNYASGSDSAANSSSPAGRAAKIVAAGNKVIETPKSLPKSILDKFRAVIGMEERALAASPAKLAEAMPKREITRYSVMAETSFLPTFDASDFPSFIAHSEHPWLTSLGVLMFLAACAAVPYFFRRKRRAKS